MIGGDRQCPFVNYTLAFALQLTKSTKNLSQVDLCRESRRISSSQNFLFFEIFTLSGPSTTPRAGLYTALPVIVVIVLQSLALRTFAFQVIFTNRQIIF
jgi:hypothetical protein